jgi:hypothetical protein
MHYALMNRALDQTLRGHFVNRSVPHFNILSILIDAVLDKYQVQPFKSGRPGQTRSERRLARGGRSPAALRVTAWAIVRGRSTTTPARSAPIQNLLSLTTIAGSNIGAKRAQAELHRLGP